MLVRRCAECREPEIFVAVAFCCSSFFCLCGMQRRGLALEVRPSPYSVQSRGGDKPRPIAVGASASLPTGATDRPRPVVRAIGGLPALQLSVVSPKPVEVRSRQHVVSLVSRGWPPSGSMAEKEETQRQGLALSLVNIAAAVRGDSSVLQSLDGLTPERLAFLFKDRAPGTLKKHLSGWRRWLIFCRASGVQAGRPECREILDFLGALAEGASCDRGSRRSGAARGGIYALRFIAHKLALAAFGELLRGPVVTAWFPAEALPLPLLAVCELERAVLQCDELADRFLMGCYLVMLWSGLRFSDARRIELSSLQIADCSLRGWCWRSKTCPTGFAWGCQISGATGYGWAQWLGAELLSAHEACPQRDFLFASTKGPVAYATALAHLRRCLVKYTSLAVTEARQFTLHSLKTTLLTWGLQLQVGVEERAAQGHHRLRNSSGCVEKCRRDDVLPALRCQRAVIRAVRSGWVPCTALARGAVAVAERDPRQLLLPLGPEHGLLESETEAEDDAAENASSEGEVVDSDSDDSVQSDALSVVSDLEGGPVADVMSG